VLKLIDKTIIEFIIEPNIPIAKLGILFLILLFKTFDPLKSLIKILDIRK
jgi:hypothetical protein